MKGISQNHGIIAVLQRHTMLNLTNRTFLNPELENTIDFFNVSNDSYQVFDLLTFSHESRVEAIVYILLFFLAAAGNVPVLFSLIRNRRRKSRIQNMILHLAIADLIVTFIMIPLEVIWRITVEWVAGDIACRVMLFLRAFGPYLSSMVLVCISLDRYSAIVHPLRVNDAQRRAKIMLYFAWAISFVCSVPQSVIFHVERHPVHQSFEQCVSFNFFPAEYQKVTYNIFCVMALYGIPLLLIIFCYSRIMWEIRMRSRRTNSSPNDGNQPTTGRLRLRLSDLSHIQRARTRTLKMTIIIVFTFFFCWTPYVVIDLWYLFDPESAEALDPRIQTFLFMFAVSNSCVNPLVYGSYIFNFSAFLRRLFHCKKPIKGLSRQASAVTRFTQIDRMHNNGCLQSTAEGHTYRLYQTEHHASTPETCLELKNATPLRRPLIRNRRNECEDSAISLSSPSRSQSCSNRCSEDGNLSFD